MTPLKLPKTAALDLRPLDVIVAEWNREHPDMPLRVWKRDVFRHHLLADPYLRFFDERRAHRG